MSYWTNNARSDSVLVILHGFRGNHKGLAEFARSLLSRKVIMLDLPGYGGSEPFDSVHDLSSYAHFLRDFFKALELPKAVVIGHSFGASIAIVFTCLYPRQIEKLVLIAPVTHAHTLEASLGKAYYHIARWLPLSLKSTWIKSSLIDYISYVILLRTSAPRRYHRLILANQKNLKNLDERVVTENFLGFYAIDLYACAAKIQAPTLLVFGDADHISPAASMAKLQNKIADCTVSIIPQAGHLVPLEKPYAVSHIVKDFLN